jgi:flagellar assembly factor FliW
MKITFEKGILGFEDIIEYELKDLESNPIFKELNSIKEKGLGFVVISPFDIDDKYEINLSDNIIKELNINSPKDVMVLSILTLGQTLERTTVNMKAPLIINVNNGLGKQIILQKEKYKVKTPLLRSGK